MYIDHHVKLSSKPGIADGFKKDLIDGEFKQDLTNVVTDNKGKSFEWLTLPYYVAHDPGGD